MKVAFLSNYFNHHQSAFSDAMYRLCGGNYTFIETEPMTSERIKMGWKQDSLPPYVKKTYSSKEEAEVCQSIINEADVVIFGSAPKRLLRNRLKNGRCIFRYSERIYRNLYGYCHIPLHFFTLRIPLNSHPGQYLLCASAYTAADFAITNSLVGKTFKWGYFPKFKSLDVDPLFARRKENNKPVLLWVGRFIAWKHPDLAILLAEKLRAVGYDFQLQIIGTGPMESQLRELIRSKNLEDCVRMLGAMKPEAVREHMEAADIFLFTSDFNEGWGAVLNESMNSACAVVASHAIGSVPFLIENGQNGLIYRNGDFDSLFFAVKSLMDSPSLRESLGRSAYKTITENWNADIAAERFLCLAKAALSDGDMDVFDSGICSRADILSNSWF